MEKCFFLTYFLIGEPEAGAGFEEIIPAMNGIFDRHMPQLDTQDRCRPS